jgi:MinD superfamily P-loop ATPase
MAVKWSAVAPYIENGFASGGQIVRGPIVDAAEDDGAADAVVDALDGIGSRVFNSVDDAKAFLVTQGLVED